MAEFNNGIRISFSPIAQEVVLTLLHVESIFLTISYFFVLADLRFMFISFQSVSFILEFPWFFSFSLSNVVFLLLQIISSELLSLYLWLSFQHLWYPLTGISASSQLATVVLLTAIFTSLRHSNMSRHSWVLWYLFPFYIASLEWVS